MTPTEYWKRRCELAENLITVAEATQLFFDKNHRCHKEWVKWQELVNTPPPTDEKDS